MATRTTPETQAEIRNQLLQLRQESSPGWDSKAQALILRALNVMDGKPVEAFVDLYLNNQAALHGMAEDNARKGSDR